MVIDEVWRAMGLEMTVRMGVSGATGAVTASCSRDYLMSGDRGGGNFIRQCPNIRPELEKTWDIISLLQQKTFLSDAKMHLNDFILQEEGNIFLQVSTNSV